MRCFWTVLHNVLYSTLSFRLPNHVDSNTVSTVQKEKQKSNSDESTGEDNYKSLCASATRCCFHLWWRKLQHSVTCLMVHLGPAVTTHSTENTRPPLHKTLLLSQPRSAKSKISTLALLYSFVAHIGQQVQSSSWTHTHLFLTIFPSRKRRSFCRTHIRLFLLSNLIVQEEKCCMFSTLRSMFSGMTACTTGGYFPLKQPWKNLAFL